MWSSLRHPPENAIVLSVDEKTSVQALETTQPHVPLTKGQIERHTHDYKRNGVVDLYAALGVASGVGRANAPTRTPALTSWRS